MPMGKSSTRRSIPSPPIPHYSMLCSSEPNGKRSPDCLELDDDYEVVKEVLRILYHVGRSYGTLKLHSPDELLKLHKFSDKRDIPMIRQLCEEELLAQPSRDSLDVALLLKLGDVAAKLAMLMEDKAENEERERERMLNQEKQRFRAEALIHENQELQHIVNGMKLAEVRKKIQEDKLKEAQRKQREENKIKQEKRAEANRKKREQNKILEQQRAEANKKKREEKKLLEEKRRLEAQKKPQGKKTVEVQQRAEARKKQLDKKRVAAERQKWEQQKIQEQKQRVEGQRKKRARDEQSARARSEM